MPDSASLRKPPRRFWLFAPYVAALALALVWSVAWLILSQVLVQRMDADAGRLRARGWVVGWSARNVGGYPFRLDVTLEAPHIAEPSGWAITAPRLKGEAYVYAPDHWVLVAPQGLALTRPGRGAVGIAGQALRASLDGLGQSGVPRIAVEGVKLILTPAPGAAPLPIAACEHFGLYVRPLADDQAEAQLDLTGAVPTGGLLARLDPGQPINLTWDQTLTRTSALKGSSWPAAVRAWSAAGGVVSATHGQLSAADLGLSLQSGALTIDADGRPQGDLSLSLSHATAGRLGPAAVLAALFHSRLKLKGGAVLLGPFRIAAAPKVF